LHKNPASFWQTIFPCDRFCFAKQRWPKDFVKVFFPLQPFFFVSPSNVGQKNWSRFIMQVDTDTVDAQQQGSGAGAFPAAVIPAIAIRNEQGVFGGLAPGQAWHNVFVPFDAAALNSQPEASIASASASASASADAQSNASTSSFPTVPQGPLRGARPRERFQPRSQAVTTQDMPEVSAWRGVKCVGCDKGEALLTGPRYKCSVCPHVDLCKECNEINVAHRNHVMLELKHARQVQGPLRV